MSDALQIGDRILMTRTFMVAGADDYDERRSQTMVVELLAIDRRDPRGAVLTVREVERVRP